MDIWRWPLETRHVLPHRLCEVECLLYLHLAYDAGADHLAMWVTGNVEHDAYGETPDQGLPLASDLSGQALYDNAQIERYPRTALDRDNPIPLDMLMVNQLIDVPINTITQVCQIR